MPRKYYKRKRKRTYKKRKYKKKNSSRTNRTDITQRNSILPTKFRMLLPYGTQRNLSTTGGIGTHVFSVNGMYDPDISGIGHQPRGFDEVMPMYDKYNIIGFQAQMIFENQTSNDGHIVGAYISESAGSFTMVDDIIENSNTTFKKVEGQLDGGSSIVHVNVRVNPNKFLGISDPLDNDQTKGDASNNPNRQVYLHVFAYPIDNTATGGNIRVQLKLDYVSIFTEPIQPASS